VDESVATFAAVLRRFRAVAGLTQEELAERAGLTAKAISALERGERRRPYPHTVRALAAALELDELDRASLVAAVPPSQRGRRSSVPASAHTDEVLTASVGRDVEAAEVLDLLARPDVRLLTVTGPGGVGKTHLAHRAAAAARAGSDVVVVPLAGVEDPALALPVIAHSLGLVTAQAAPIVDALAERLAGRTTLLVLDNLEQLPSIGPHLVELLRRCPGCTVLGTSRAALRVRGEHDYVLAPLGLPPPDAVEAQIAASPAVSLFGERAAAVVPDFALVGDTARTVAAICRHVDGLPLAIEIAAAQLRYTDAATLLERLDLLLDVPGQVDLPARQRSLRATLQWSHDLLDPEAQVALRRLGVLLGTWTLADAEAVAAGTGLPAPAVLAALGRLVEQSLVTVVRGGTRTRYRILEPVRRFAVERLAAIEEEAAVRDRHARWFAACADRPGPDPIDGETVLRYDQLDAAQPNLAAALERLLDIDPAAAAHLCWSLWGMWMVRGHQFAGLELSRRALDRAPDDLAAAEAAVATAVMELFAGDPATLPALSELAAEAASRADAPWVEANARRNLGAAYLLQGRLEAARTEFGTAIEAAIRAGDGDTAAACQVHLATVESREGDRAAARRRLQEVLSGTEGGIHLPARAQASLQLAFETVVDGDAEAARAYVRRALDDGALLQDTFILRGSALALACLAALAENGEAAAQLVGIAEGYRPSNDLSLATLVHHDQRFVDALLARVRRHLGDEAFEGAVTGAAELPDDEARAVLLAHLG
jgi:predicted ATPase/DNA-binding XRE family transcriptional regulator